MKNLIIYILILISNYAFAQPNPQDSYPKRIEAINDTLKTDSLNYALIWESLAMRVNLMNSFGTIDVIFSLEIDSTKKARQQSMYSEQFNIDFNKIYDNIILSKQFDIVEEGDFYLNRIWFYFNMYEFDKAIEDAKYLRDYASYSKFSERGDYYNNWALYSLFNLYVIKKQYNEALEALNSGLDKNKRANAKVYFAGGGSFFSYHQKIRLFEHFNQTDKIIPFLKKTCLEHFDWYFENFTANNDDYYINTAKERGFQFLKFTIDYMKQYQDKALSKYQKIYQQLKYKMNENYETINPNISLNELKKIIDKIR